MKTRKTPKKDWADRCIAALAKYGNISKACDTVGIGRTAFYARRNEDKAFADRASDALETATDALELEARRRAHDGLERKKFDKGEPLIDPVTGQQYIEREYSDTLLIFLLKAHRPDKFRERFSHEHTGKDGKPIATVAYTVEDLAAADRELEAWTREKANHADSENPV